MISSKRGILPWVRRHPVLSVFSLWVTLIGSAGIATAMMIQTDIEPTMDRAASIAQPEYAVPLDASDRASANFAAAVAQTEPEVQQSLLLPYLSFGAIALSCTVGCLMLSQVLKSPPSPRLTRSSFLSHSQPTQTIPGQTEEFQTPPAQSEDSSVTIVPEDQSHPLDWDEPSLADSLDLRQRRPLSYWL
jgi:hypothetical protein